MRPLGLGGLGMQRVEAKQIVTTGLTCCMYVFYFDLGRQYKEGESPSKGRSRGEGAREHTEQALFSQRPCMSALQIVFTHHSPTTAASELTPEENDIEAMCLLTVCCARTMCRFTSITPR
jgi:hypothetical protein